MGKRGKNWSKLSLRRRGVKRGRKGGMGRGGEHRVNKEGEERGEWGCEGGFAGGQQLVRGAIDAATADRGALRIRVDDAAMDPFRFER